MGSSDQVRRQRRHARGGGSIVGLTRSLGRKVAGKPADLVHEGGLNSSSGQEEELAIGSSSVQQ